MEKIIRNISDPKSNIDIIGNIFICDELCNLDLEYKDHNVLSISHNGIKLNISHNNGSSITYNGGEEFGSKQIKYSLKKIIIIGPPKHYIKSHRRSNGLELILVHQSDDGKRFQNISVLLYPQDQCAKEQKLQYKLYSEIASNIPSKAESIKKVDLKWSVNDLLPDNKSFYTYNSPFDTQVNWIIFKNQVCVPTELVENYRKLVLNIKENKDAKDKWLSASIPSNPNTLILFGHQIVKNVSSQCAKKIVTKVNSKEDATTSLSSSTDMNQIKKDLVVTSEQNKKDVIKKDTTKEDTKLEITKKEDEKEDGKDDKKEDKKEDEKEDKEWSFLDILLFIVGIFILLYLAYWLILTILDYFVLKNNNEVMWLLKNTTPSYFFIKSIPSKNIELEPIITPPVEQPAEPNVNYQLPESKANLNQNINKIKSNSAKSQTNTNRQRIKNRANVIANKLLKNPNRITPDHIDKLSGIVNNNKLNSLKSAYQKHIPQPSTLTQENIANKIKKEAMSKFP